MKYGAKTLICVLIVSTTMLCTLPSAGWAMLIPASSSAERSGRTDGRAADMKRIQAALESKAVRERLQAFGLNDGEIDSRLSRLSDQQVHKLAKDIDTLGPGGDVGVGGILVIVLLVVLIVYLIKRM
jgi:hypothetical protein